MTGYRLQVSTLMPVTYHATNLVMITKLFSQYHTVSYFKISKHVQTLFSFQKKPNVFNVKCCQKQPYKNLNKLVKKISNIEIKSQSIQGLIPIPKCTHLKYTESKGWNLFVLHVNHKAQGGPLNKLDLQFDGKVSLTILSPCHYSEEKQRSRLSEQWGEDVWAVKMSKEKVGGQRADLWLIPSNLGAPLGPRQYICLRCPLTSSKLALTHLTQDHRGDLWHGYTCIYTQRNTDKAAVVEFTYER